MKNHSQKDGWPCRVVVAVLGLTVVPNIVGTIHAGSHRRIGIGSHWGRLAHTPMKR